MHADIITIVKRIKNIRQDLELTADQMAVACNIPGNSYKYFESKHGGTIVSFLQIIAFCTSKGYNINWILKQNNTNILKKGQSPEMLTFDLMDVKDFSNQIKQHTDSLLDNIIGSMNRFKNDISEPIENIDKAIKDL